jgi:GntR family transcriptional regulator, transcriptional repressor for pyruvate dehydrogenase complex
VGITEDAIAKVRDLIVSGELPAGSRLPAEQEFAAELGLSRGSVREVVRALTYMQLVEVRRGDGTYVAGLEPDRLLDGVRLAAEAARDHSLLDVLEVRKLLEPSAAALTALRITDEELAQLHEHLELMRASNDDPEAFMHHDANFHDCIAEATRNAWLAALLKGLARPTMHVRLLRLQLQHEVPGSTVAQHEQIYAAIALRDPALAKAASLIHVSSTGEGVARLSGAVTDNGAGVDRTSGAGGHAGPALARSNRTQQRNGS